MKSFAAAQSNAKVIIIGEYALMHDAKAIAFAWPKLCCSVAVTKNEKEIINLRINSPERQFEMQTHWQQTVHCYQQVKQKHQQFLRGHCCAHEVISEDKQLLLVALAMLQQALNIKLGLDIVIDSQIPLGCGLGSSAVVAASLFKAINRLLGEALNEQELLQLVLNSENFAHGKTGGLDAYISLFQYPVVWQNGQVVETYALDLKPYSWQLINTGRPCTSTAACVAQVQQTHPASHGIWQQFAKLSENFVSALMRGDDLGDLIRGSHRLLCELGVVSATTRQLIANIERLGGAAKTTGSGSVQGEASGAVLCYGLSALQLRSLGLSLL